MKPVAFVILVISGFAASAQSESFTTLREKFRGKHDVVCISTSGVLARTVLMMAGERDFKRSIRYVKNIRLVTVPKQAFLEENVSVNGFRNILKKDAFIELARINDHGDEVSLYLQEAKNKKHNKYFILIDDDHEVIGIEIKGYVDPQEMTRQSASARR